MCRVSVLVKEFSVDIRLRRMDVFWGKVRKEVLYHCHCFARLKNGHNAMVGPAEAGLHSATFATACGSDGQDLQHHDGGRRGILQDRYLGNVTIQMYLVSAVSLPYCAVLLCLQYHGAWFRFLIISYADPLLYHAVYCSTMPF
jgi:hypothetical protein